MTVDTLANRRDNRCVGGRGPGLSVNPAHIENLSFPGRGPNPSRPAKCGGAVTWLPSGPEKGAPEVSSLGGSNDRDRDRGAIGIRRRVTGVASASPAFQFYPSDFLTSTSGWPPAARGAYIVLLCHQWECGFIPDDMQDLFRIVGAFPDELEPLWAERLEEKFPLDEDGKRRNPRLEKVRDEQRQYREQKIRAGKKSARVRAKKYGTAQPVPEHRSERRSCSRSEHPSEHPSEREPERSPNPLSPSPSSSSTTTPSSTEPPPSPPANGGESAQSEGNGKTNDSGYPPDFEEFWDSYPKKRSKRDAAKAWKQTKKERPPTEEIVDKVENLAGSHDWTKEGGKFVPYPGTWLRAGGWDDEVGNGGPSGSDEIDWSQVPGERIEVEA